MEDMPRAIRMAYEYLNGRTLVEIGEKYELTRERVRQIISSFGLTRGDGGASIRSFANERWKKKDPLDRYLNAYGCTRREALEINFGEFLTKRGSPAQRFKSQRTNAKTRGIGWELTLPQWWKVWVDSGKWSERGRGKGYCMTRIGDTGPYSPDNVEVKTNSDNFKESFYKHPHEERVKKAIENGKNPLFARKTHCKRGHELTPENRYRGVGFCLVCQKLRYREQKKSQSIELAEAA